MSVADFDMLTPGEFGVILEQWRREQRRQESFWLSGVRLHAAISVSPYCKKAPQPHELFEIPLVDNPPGSGQKLTKEERRARFNELKKQRGYE